MEMVEGDGGCLSVVLAGWPKLRNDLRRPKLEEIGLRADIFPLEGRSGSQKDYIKWLLTTWTERKETDLQGLITTEAIEFLATRLKTALQIEWHLTQAFEAGYQTGESKIVVEEVEAILSRPDSIKAHAAFELAYAGIRTAFEYYLEQYNNGRPIIIAGHSQGALMAERLLKEYFENKTLKNKLVVAYIIGWPVSKRYYTSLQVCTDSLQTGCFCSWRTFKKGYTPSYVKKDTSGVYVTNPLNWTTANGFVSRKLNKGSILRNFNKIYKHTTDAQIGNGVLYTRKPTFPWSFLFLSKNYHVGDINLYYLNIRENVKQRISLFWKK